MEDSLVAAVVNHLNGYEATALLLETHGDGIKITERIFALAAGNGGSGRKVSSLLLEKRGHEIQITVKILVAAAANKQDGRQVMDLLLQERGKEITITEEVLKAAAANESSGRDVIALLLERRGNEIRITEEILKAAIANESSGRDLIALLLERRGNEIRITEEILKAAAANRSNGRDVIDLLLKQCGNDIQITDAVIEVAKANKKSGVLILYLLLEKWQHKIRITEKAAIAIAQTCTKKMMVLLLEGRGGEIQITEELLMAVAANGWSGGDVMAFLLQERGDKIRITNNILRVAAANRHYGVNLIALLLKERGEEIRITENTLKAAVTNDKSGLSIISLLLKERGKEIKVTDKVIKAAVANKASGSSIISLLLKERGEEVKVTEEVFKAVTHQTSSFSALQAWSSLLKKRGEAMRITNDVVKAAAASEVAGLQIMDLILQERGDEFRVTEEVLKAAVSNRISGPSIMALLLEKRAEEISITDEVLRTAAANKSSGLEILTTLLDMRRQDVRVSDGLLKAARANKASGSKIVALLTGGKEETALEGLIAGMRSLPQPLQDALAPILQDETFRKQVEQRFSELERNFRLTQKSARGLLDDFGQLKGENNVPHDTAFPGESLQPDQVRSQIAFTEEAQQRERESPACGRTTDLIMGLQSLPQPLPETLGPFLENEPFRRQVEERFIELERNTKLRQESAFDLLHALGPLEETDSGGHDGASTTCQGDVELGSRLPGDDGASQDEPSVRPPALPEDQPSQEDGPAIGVQTQSHLQILEEKFFNWSSLDSRKLPPTEDILEKKYLAVLAIYDKVKANIGVHGATIGLEGVPILLRHFLHKDDYVTLFRSARRRIRLPIRSVDEIPWNLLENLETDLFDTSKFCGFDTRLTCVTYNDGKYGTITLFTVSTDNTRPIKIRPVAAMKGVPKVLLEKIGDGVGGSSKTKLSMPQHEIWKATEQWKVGRWKKQVLRPEFMPQHAATVGSRMTETLRTALSMDDISFHCLNATVPQMIAMLHHKASLIEDIESTPVYLDGDRDGVRMVQGPYMMGHTNGNARIIVLAPARGSWVEEQLSWK